MSTKKIQILGSVLTTDETLTQSGIAADAKVVGEALAGKQPIGDYALKSELENLRTTVTEQISGAVEAINPDDIGAADVEHTHDEYVLKDDIAQPDWSQNDENAADYVKNRTHYVEGVEEIVNLPETTLELLDGSSDEFTITTPFLAPIEVDTTYNIVYNGSEYECKAQSFTAGDQTAIMLGNIGALTGGTDTGEPFIMAIVPDELVGEIGYYAMFEVSDGAEAITVSISTTKEIVKTIDPKYLAEGADGHKQLVTDAVGNAKWADKTHYVEKVEETIVVPETTLTLDEYGDMYLTEPLSSSIELNEPYTIIYNGTEYTCFAQEFTMDAITAYVLGNIGKVSGEGADTGEPFVFIVIPSDIAAEEGVYGQLEPFDGAETVVLEIIHKDEKVKTLDPKYLANGVGEYKQLVTDAEGNTVWEDRLAWSEPGVTVVPEATYTLENGSANIATPFLTPLVIGREYKVIYNGTTYTSSAIEMVEDGMTGKLLGNFSLVTGTGDTGEPFIIIEFPAEQTVESGFYWAIADIGGTGTEVTLSITETDIVHKIPVKYLGTPNWNASKGEDGYIENRTHYINQTDVEIMPETTFTGISGENIVNATTSNFTAGTNCVVTWNGVDYECVIQSGANSVNEDMLVAYVGNGTKLSGIKTDDPFLFAKLTPAGAAQVGGGYILYAMDGSTTVTMKIVEPAGAVHQLDKKFIPSDLMDGYVPTARTINGKTLSSDITLSAFDVGALPDTTIIPSADNFATKVYVDEAFDTLNIKNGDGNYSICSPSCDANSLYTIALGQNTVANRIGTYVIGKFNNPEALYDHTFGTLDNIAYSKTGTYSLISGAPTFDSMNGKFIYDSVSKVLGSELQIGDLIATGSYNNSYTELIALVGSDDNNQYFNNKMHRVVSYVNAQGTHAFVIGNGLDDSSRSNAHTLDWSGNAWYAGDVLVGGTSQEDAKVLATKEYVDEQMASAGSVSSVNGKTGAVELTAADVGAPTESYVDEKVAGLVESAPETLNTLNELAAALGDDPNFATTVSTQIGNKVDKTTTINGKALSSNIILTAADVNADPAGTAQAKINKLYIKNGNNNSLVSAWAAAESDAYSLGYHAIALGDSAKASGSYSHAEGNLTTASGSSSHAEGHGTIASGSHSHAEGCCTTASGYNSHAEGGVNFSSLTITGEANALTYTCSKGTPKNNYYLMGENGYSKIIDINLKDNTIIVDQTLSSVAIFEKAIYAVSATGASGGHSHVEGNSTTASGDYSHAEGYYTEASGDFSHTEGYYTKASGDYSHAEGYYTKASGQESHAEGNYTIAASLYQHVQGKYNVEDADRTYAHIVGNGESDTARSNAHTLDWQGNAWFQGNVYVGGTNQDEGSEKLLTQSEVNSIINELLAAILPTPTIEDAGKVLRVNEEGKYELVAPLTNEEIDDICGSTVQVSSEMVDEATGESYRLYVSNGELKMEKVV